MSGLAGEKSRQDGSDGGLMTQELNERYRACRERLESRGQGHLLRWWDELDAEARRHLLGEIESIPWGVIDPLLESHVRARPVEVPMDDLAPPATWRREPAPEQEPLYRAAADRGAQLIADGKVGAFTVAGGQATRLGFDGPKGAMTITPVREKSLFQLFAETIAAVQARYGVRIPWYIMTSPANHRQTLGFLSDHEYFGLPKQDVMLFNQRMLPSCDFQGRMLLSDRSHLALAPDGHGGALKSLSLSGALRDMQERGVEIVSFFQVDNPLVAPFDPLFIGLHRLTGSELSTKVARKASDFERVGNVCLAGGKVVVVEYSNFPAELATVRQPDGRRRFDCGNLAIHLLERSFIERIVGREFELPFHRSEKSVTWLDEHGRERSSAPETPNAVKLETYVFDALPLASNPLLLEVERGEEFSPVKNAAGNDSVATAVRDQVRRAARWLEAAGATIPRTSAGEPAVTLEIAPAYALTQDEFLRRGPHPMALQSGEAVYLS
ncbi:MAG: UTP--glucose-1-phosphate uridylyltransferase [Planctomycetales bacterium]